MKNKNRLLRDAHVRADKKIYLISKDLEKMYKNDSQELIDKFLTRFKEFENIIEDNLNKFESEEINKEEYKDIIIKKVFLSKSWKATCKELAKQLNKTNSKALKMINNNMSEIYIDNYNTIQKTVTEVK